MVAVENNFFRVEGELKQNLDRLDRLNLRTGFKQASDPIFLAFDYIDSKPLNKIVKEFAQETVEDIFEFIAKVFNS